MILNRYLNLNKKFLRSSSNLIFNNLKSYYSTFNPTMRFIQFTRKDNPVIQLGSLTEDGKSFVQLSQNVASSNNDMINFIKKMKSIDEVKARIAELPIEELTSDIEILPPIHNPEKIVCIGLNYLDHCLEQNLEKPKEPMFFSKFASTLVGPYGNIIAHSISNKIDWEVEMAVVIGKEAKNVSKENAFDYVFGYTIAQDISARDWQKERNGGQFLIGKSMDSFCPLGPAIVHKSLIDDPHNLNISCKVNGNLKQNSNTTNLIYKVDDIIYHLTQSMTLKPGDVILTGTPGGVGMSRKPQEFLKPGDVVESSIEGLGTINNNVVNDK